MHPSSLPARAVPRISRLRELLSKIDPIHQAVAMSIVEREPARLFSDGRRYRKEEVRLLLADGTAWRLPEVLVEAEDRSLTLRSAAWSLHCERKKRHQHPCWVQLPSPNLAD